MAALLFAVLTLAALPAAAVVPRTFSVQGVLRDKMGALQSQTASSVTVKLFAAQAPSAGEMSLAEWSQTGVGVSNGIFTVAVAVDDKMEAALAQPEVWLELTVDHDTYARQRLTPDVYALACGTADALAPSAVVSGAQLAPGSVPATALAPSVTQPQWQAAAIDTTQFTNYGPPYNDAAYFLDAFGVVHLRGLVRYVDKTAQGKTMVVLPANVRPAHQWLLPAVVSQTVDGLAQSGMARVDVKTTGELTINAYGKYPVDWISLDGLTYTLN
jgi:hypothetical protein